MINEILTKAVFSVFSRRQKPLLTYVKRHLGGEPRKFSIVQAQFPLHRHGCLHRAIEQFLGGKRRRGVVLGTSAADAEIKLSDLVRPDYFEHPVEGPVEFIDVLLADGGRLSCAKRALYLVRDNGKRFVVMVSLPRYEDVISVEVIARDRSISEGFLTELRRLADEHSIYKGHVISMKEDAQRELVVHFLSTPSVSRQQLILPDSVIYEIERHTIGFSVHRDLLISRGRHIKRGLLLYGPPGTGKSLTINYLVTAMPDRTTILLNGNSVKHLEDACTLARALQPATVVIDDVDLVALERTRRHANPLLFELLNQMDAVTDDADVLFLLTTNRPEVLEPALASRPGRIDQAIMIPLPDEECRKRLFDLYASGLPIEINDWTPFLEKTYGVSAAFIRELFRKSALLALEDGRDVSIRESHLNSAMSLLQSCRITSSLFGKTPEDNNGSSDHSDSVFLIR
jgi:DNA polymerase III delta prime subunit